MGPTVVYVAGSGRSGSTLLDTMLGQLPRVVSTGELGGLWGRGILRDDLCECGEPVPVCPFWRVVIDRVGGPPLEEVLTIQTQLLRNRSVSAIVRGKHGSLQPLLDTYVPVLGRLYDAVADTADADVVVDSSKRAAGAAVAAIVPGIRLVMVQLVRDPRAVAHSWSRIKEIPTLHGTNLLPQRSAASSATHWIGANLGAERVARAMPIAGHVTVRYEDLVDDPVAALGPTLELIHRRAEDLPVEDRAVLIRPGHTVSGNPSRFSHGAVPLRPDDEWRSAQSVRDQLVATMLTGPLLRRYGYRLRPSSI